MLNIPKRNNGRRNLAQTELLHRRGKGVVRVRRARLNLPHQLAVGEHRRVENGLRPVGFCFGEDGGVEDVVVAVVGVGATHACVVFEDVVSV